MVPLTTLVLIPEWGIIDLDWTHISSWTGLWTLFRHFHEVTTENHGNWVIASSGVICIKRDSFPSQIAPFWMPEVFDQSLWSFPLSNKALSEHLWPIVAVATTSVCAVIQETSALSIRLWFRFDILFYHKVLWLAHFPLMMRFWDGFQVLRYHVVLFFNGDERTF